MNVNETGKIWRPQGREVGVLLYLSDVAGIDADVLGSQPAGLPVNFRLVPVTEWVDPAELSGAAIGILQIDADTPASIKRFERLAAATDTPLIAAAYDPPLALVRSLLRSGAHDVLPLPLSFEEIETAIASIHDREVERTAPAQAANSRLVSMIKSRGGSGATSLLTQLACRFAQSEARQGRTACLIDFDVQFGDAAFQLGYKPKLNVGDLVEAGNRLDSALLRSVAVTHPCGLAIVASPSEMIPLESITNDQVIAIVDHAQRTFDTVFVDLPANWTHWSLSLVARSQVAFLVTELNVASLNQARRQLDLIEEQNLDDVSVQVVLNRFEKGLFQSVKTSDVEAVLGRPAAFTVAQDTAVMTAAVDQGVLINEVKRKSGIGRDIDNMDAGLAAALGLER